MSTHPTDSKIKKIAEKYCIDLTQKYQFNDDEDKKSTETLSEASLEHGFDPNNQNKVEERKSNELRAHQRQYDDVYNNEDSPKDQQQKAADKISTSASCTAAKSIEDIMKKYGLNFSIENNVKTGKPITAAQAQEQIDDIFKDNASEEEKA